MEQIIYPLSGGIAIALSSTILLGGIGRILGVSGILGSFFKLDQQENSWRFVWLIGLFSGAY